jgi:hypothetical protein
VTPPDSQAVASILRSALGDDERRYRRFVAQLWSPRSDGLIMFWQCEVLDGLERDAGLVLPRNAAELAALLPALTTLSETEVPSWLHVEELSGACPVQGVGTVGAWRWYFRARHDCWSISASRDTERDPVDVFGNSSNTFYTEEPYGDSSEAASYMPLDEARFYIVRELRRLRGLLCEPP